jgi:hypothetical protein
MSVTAQGVNIAWQHATIAARLAGNRIVGQILSRAVGKISRPK